MFGLTPRGRRSQTKKKTNSSHLIEQFGRTVHLNRRVCVLSVPRPARRWFIVVLYTSHHRCGRARRRGRLSTGKAHAIDVRGTEPPSGRPIWPDGDFVRAARVRVGFLVPGAARLLSAVGGRFISAYGDRRATMIVTAATTTEPAHGQLPRAGPSL